MREPLSDSLRNQIAGSTLSVNEIAQRSGISQAVLCRFLNRKRTLRLDTADRLANYFGLAIEVPDPASEPA